MTTLASRKFGPASVAMSRFVFESSGLSVAFAQEGFKLWNPILIPTTAPASPKQVPTKAESRVTRSLVRPCNLGGVYSSGLNSHGSIFLRWP